MKEHRPDSFKCATDILRLAWNGGRHMASRRIGKQNVSAISHALELVTKAMDVLDAHDELPEAAVHLSLAQEHLRRVVRASSKES